MFMVEHLTAESCGCSNICSVLVLSVCSFILGFFLHPFSFKHLMIPVSVLGSMACFSIYVLSICNNSRLLMFFSFLELPNQYILQVFS